MSADECLVRIDHAENSSSVPKDSRIVVEYDVEKRIMNVNVAVVINQAQLAKLVHKKTHSHRVVPIISASVPWLIFTLIVSVFPSVAKFARREAALRDAFRWN